LGGIELADMATIMAIVAMSEGIYTGKILKTKVHQDMPSAFSRPLAHDPIWLEFAQLASAPVFSNTRLLRGARGTLSIYSMLMPNAARENVESLLDLPRSTTRLNSIKVRTTIDAILQHSKPKFALAV